MTPVPTRPNLPNRNIGKHRKMYSKLYQQRRTIEIGTASRETLRLDLSDYILFFTWGFFIRQSRAKLMKRETCRVFDHESEIEEMNVSTYASQFEFFIRPSLKDYSMGD